MGGRKIDANVVKTAEVGPFPLNFSYARLVFFAPVPEYPAMLQLDPNHASRAFGGGARHQNTHAKVCPLSPQSHSSLGGERKIVNDALSLHPTFMQNENLETLH